MTNDLLLRSVHFSLTLLLSHLNLRLRCRVPLLLVRDHLLTSGFALRLLLLTQNILLLHLLTHAFALRLLSGYALSALLFDLLSLKLVHLLPSIAIAAGRLPRKISHLFLAPLLDGELSLLSGCLAPDRRAIRSNLLSTRGPVVSKLKFVFLGSVPDLLNPQRLRQVSAERWRNRGRAGDNRGVTNPLSNHLRHIYPSLRSASFERGSTQRIDL